MILSLVISFIIGSGTADYNQRYREKRAKMMDYLAYLFCCMFVVFLILLASFQFPVSYPWIMSVEPIPVTLYGNDNWWVTLRFLNYEVLKCKTHEIYLGSERICLILFASNLLAGAMGVIVGRKFPSLVKHISNRLNA